VYRRVEPRRTDAGAERLMATVIRLGVGGHANPDGLSGPRDTPESAAWPGVSHTGEYGAANVPSGGPGGLPANSY
jgi:hypothetical protein